MKMGHKILLFFLALFLVTTPLVPSTLAAELYGDETITITEQQQLDNPYLFGERVEVAVPVQNDLVSAGGNLLLDGEVEGSIWAAGGDIQIQSTVGNSVRVAGGNITINGTINEDLIVMGGSVRVTEDASISGDLIFLGGQLQLDAPIGGDVMANGGDITINSQIDGNVSGEMGRLILGDDARINGNLSYTAEERSDITNDQVAGNISFKESQAQEKAKDGVAGIITAGTIYTLVADTLFVLLLLWLLRPFLTRVIDTIDNNYLKNAGLGFATLILTPLIAVISLTIIWLGLSVFLLYGLLLILSLGIMKLFIGWKTLSWWERRNGREYFLDWKAVITGVLIVFVLGLIPVFGWLLGFILFLLALGGITNELFSLMSLQQIKDTKSTSRSKKK